MGDRQRKKFARSFRWSMERLITVRRQHEISITVIGMGYFGLPFAVEFKKIRSVIGFDLKSNWVTVALALPSVMSLPFIGLVSNGVCQA